MKRLLLWFPLFMAFAIMPSVYAETPVPIPVDMTQILHDIDGKVIKDQIGMTADDPTCAKCTDLTLGHAVAHALMWSSPDDQKLSAEQKFSRGMMAERLRDNKSATLDAGETTAIQNLLARLYGPAIVLPAVKLLDPNMKPEKLR